MLPKLRTSFALAAATVVALVTPGLVGAQETPTAPAAPAAAEADVPQGEVPFFGNETCPVMGKKVKLDKFAEKDGKRVYVCCAKCVKRVEADFDAAYELAYPAESAKDLKNPKCPIMGGDAAADVTAEFQGHLVHFCCPGCDRKFAKEPNRHLALLTRPGLVVLGNETCLVEKDAEVAPDTFVIFEGVLLDASSATTAAALAKDPQRYLKAAGIDLAKVRAADG